MDKFNFNPRVKIEEQYAEIAELKKDAKRMAELVNEEMSTCSKELGILVDKYDPFDWEKAAQRQTEIAELKAQIELAEGYVEKKYLDRYFSEKERNSDKRKT